MPTAVKFHRCNIPCGKDRRGKSTAVWTAANCASHTIPRPIFFSLQAFFTSGAMMNVLETFCIYHITAPGQEAGAKDLPEGYVYPTMDELADQVRSTTKYICKRRV